MWYRIHLTVRDSGGLTHETWNDLVPRKAAISLATSPSGLQLTLDGQPVTTPFSTQGVVGIRRTLGAVSPQASGGRTYAFQSWSDGGAQTHEIVTPSADTVVHRELRRRPGAHGASRDTHSMSTAGPRRMALL